MHRARWVYLSNERGSQQPIASGDDKVTTSARGGGLESGSRSKRLLGAAFGGLAFHAGSFVQSHALRLFVSGWLVGRNESTGLPCESFVHYFWLLTLCGINFRCQQYRATVICTGRVKV